MSYSSLLRHPDALHAFYDDRCAAKTAIAAHLPRLFELAYGLDEVVEFGVKAGGSTSAFLLAAQHVTSVDLKPVPDVNQRLQEYAGDAWTFIQGDTRTVTIPTCDLLFLDANHTFASVDAELRAHADKVSKLLVFHDTITFGSIGARDETGEWSWQYRRGQSVPLEHLGIRPAIDLLMIRDPDWFIQEHYFDSHGLLVLCRRSSLR
jgi:hypothetical protein